VASTYCETCVDIISTECVYYKGTYSNCLGLVKNFRLDDFIEKTLSILCSLDGGGGTDDQYLINTSTITRNPNNNSWLVSYKFPNSSKNFSNDIKVTYNMAHVEVEYRTSFSISTNSSAKVSLCSNTNLNYYYVGVGHVHNGNSTTFVGTDISTANIAASGDTDGNQRSNRQKVEGTIIFSTNQTISNSYKANLLIKCLNGSTTTTIASVPFTVNGASYKQVSIQGITPVLAPSSTIWMEISNEIETENSAGLDLFMHDGNLIVTEIPSQS
jgi:hypothetical protein